MSKRLWRVDPLLALAAGVVVFAVVLGFVVVVYSGDGLVPLRVMAGGYVGGAVAGLLVIVGLKYLDEHLAERERDAWESLRRPPGAG